MSSQSPSTRKQCDFTKLMMAGYELELNNGSTQDFYVTFHGPKETAYEGGVWKIHVSLPDDYPFASPSIGFMNKVLHPNVDEASGSVCLDVINQTWTPLYSLVNIFDVFLPQLLTYPNPSDPLNSDAASLLMSDKVLYEQRISEYVKMYANRETWEVERREKLWNDYQTGSPSRQCVGMPGVSASNGRPKSNGASTASSVGVKGKSSTASEKEVPARGGVMMELRGGVNDVSEGCCSDNRIGSLTPVSQLSDMEDIMGVGDRNFDDIDIDDL